MNTLCTRGTWIYAGGKYVKPLQRGWSHHTHGQETITSTLIEYQYLVLVFMMWSSDSNVFMYWCEFIKTLLRYVILVVSTITL